ncbi:unnamed protein product [Darwinula stevensoni]|uniref:Uncharacterized protein n=1 Tax=Darwinula stevensoni TaxID=69355 RepID=A0A7R8X6D6_9CRUS|nr:unnamed protein product [Darwinula stevensoni]CAG0881351.1 unnamed protein product [Darwinula stevensoni]
MYMNSGKIWVKCDKCGKKMKRLQVIDTLDETYKTIRRAQGLMALQKVDEALELFIGVMTTLQTCVAPPDCSLHACLQFIRQCMLGSGSVHVNGSLPNA